MRIDLDPGNWVDLKEVSELRRTDRRALNKAISYEIDPDTKRPVLRASMDDDMADAVIPLLVQNWSFPMALPSVDPNSLNALTLEQDEKLREAIQPHLDALQGTKAPTKDNAVPTPASAS